MLGWMTPGGLRQHVEMAKHSTPGVVEHTGRKGHTLDAIMGRRESREEAISGKTNEARGSEDKELFKRCQGARSKSCDDIL